MSVDRELLLKHYPFASHWLTLPGGARLHYVDDGNGDPLLMVHGNPSWSFYFRALIGAFRGSFRCVAPDHVGCGLSEKPAEARYPYTLERRVDDLVALINTLDLQRITLIVHDWGGMIGLAAALREPKRFARFVILNTAAFRKPADKPLPWQIALVRNLPLLPAVLVRGLNLFARGAADKGVVRKPLPPEVRSVLLGPYDSWANRVAILRFVQDIPISERDKSYPILEHVDRRLNTLADRPALICWGLRDFVFDATYLDLWRERWPHAEVLAIEDAGHYVLEDAGAEVVAAMKTFLAANPLPDIAQS